MHAKSFDGIRNFRYNTEYGAVAACAGERRNKPLCGKQSSTFFFARLATPDSIIIPENVTEISSSVFSNRGNLVNVTLPSSLKKIGEYAFYCSQLIHNNDNITPKNAARSELRHATCIAPLDFFVRKKEKTQQIIYGKRLT